MRNEFLRLIRNMRHARQILGVVIFALTAILLWPGAGQAQQASPPPAEGFPIGPPSQIIRFTAEPSSIQAGQSITLSWAVVNSDNMSIDQCVGVVPSRGSRQ